MAVLDRIRSRRKHFSVSAGLKVPSVSRSASTTTTLFPGLYISLQVTNRQGKEGFLQGFVSMMEDATKHFHEFRDQKPSQL
jgi:hypothetical protein